jgi:hypothetical protein
MTCRAAATVFSVPSIRCLQPLLSGGRQNQPDQPPVEDLWDWHSQAPEQEDSENAEIREVVDDLLKGRNRDRHDQVSIWS